MSTVKIKNYRGFEISFEPDTELFSCESSMYGNPESSSKSYSAVVKYIDKWHMNNNSFTPVRIAVGYGHGAKFTFVTIIGIRKDGNFTVKDDDGRVHQLSSYDEKYAVPATPAHEIFNAEVDRWEILDREFKTNKSTALNTLRSELNLDNGSSGLDYLREKFNWND